MRLLPQPGISERVVAAVLARRLTGTKHAIIASRGWELARVFEVQVDPQGPTTIVFNYLEGACPWLGIDAGAAAGIIDEVRRELRPAG